MTTLSLVMDFHLPQMLNIVLEPVCHSASDLLIRGFHFVRVRTQNKSSRSEESLLVFSDRNIQAEAAEVSLNAPSLIHREPSAAEETSREQNRGRLLYIELSGPQCGSSAVAA